jgi:hypothetical protein
MGMRFRTALTAIVLATTAIVPTVALGPAAHANYTGNAFDTPDPFMIYENGRYFAFSTGPNPDLPKCDGTRHSMYIAHRSSATLDGFGSSDCFADVMKDGPGRWATNSPYATWAPTVVKDAAHGQYLLFYTGQRASDGLRCIGRATSASITGPYVDHDATPWSCGAGGSFDPNAYVENGRLYIQWRQDSSTTKVLYGAEYSSDGLTRLSAIRTLLRASDVSWAASVIENPAVVRFNGGYYLTFSGDDWRSDKYATGFAYCGTSILASGECTLTFGSARPMWGLGHSRDANSNPWEVVEATPTNSDGLPGPGGMSFVTLAAGGFSGSGASGHRDVVLHFTQNDNPFIPVKRPMLVLQMHGLDYIPSLVDF